MPPRTQKKSSFSVREWLSQAPEQADVQEFNGAFHIPIKNLEDSLDVFRWGTRNFVWQLYKDGYAKLGVGASLELLLSYTDENGKEVVDRPFVGACNFIIESVPFGDWLATAKSLCIKNAASDAGKKLGRGLNADVVPAKKPLEGGGALVAPHKKMKADSIILERWRKAKQEGDVTYVAILENVYHINPEDNGDEAV